MLAGIYARGPGAPAVSDVAWLQAMLDAEAALARACASEHMISAQAAAAIAAACRAERFDAGELAAGAAEHASPVVPLVAALRAAVGDQHAAAVHLGATSQDILDTAAMLVLRRALAPLLEDAGAAASASAVLADRHRATPMTGRTLLQQALPTSFGLRAAGWMVGIDEACTALEQVRDQGAAVQMGGPVGTRGPAITAHVADELGLAQPRHTNRTRPAAAAGALGVLAGVLGKIARDVTLLAQDEVGELREGGAPGRGDSSAMAHKRNPVAAVSVLACTKQVPGLVATLLACMEQEHERAAGAWQAEHRVLSELLALTGSAAAWSRELLENLEVDAGRMGENLARLAAAGVEPASDHGRHLGAASELIDRALAAHRP